LLTGSFRTTDSKPCPGRYRYFLLNVWTWLFNSKCSINVDHVTVITRSSYAEPTAAECLLDVPAATPLPALEPQTISRGKSHIPRIISTGSPREASVGSAKKPKHKFGYRFSSPRVYALLISSVGLGA
jgi:hypothetical protein